MPVHAHSRLVRLPVLSGKLTGMDIILITMLLVVARVVSWDTRRYGLHPFRRLARDEALNQPAGSALKKAS